MKLQHDGYMSSAYWVLPDSEGQINVYSAQNKKPATMVVYKDHTQVTFSIHVTDNGLQVEPNGKLQILASGHLAPEWRARQRKRFGVELDFANTFAGRLFCPHTGRKVVVNHIDGNPILWVDKECGRAFRSNGAIGYDTPEGAPYQTKSSKIKYGFANQKRYQEVVARYDSIQQEAKFRYSLADIKLIMNQPINYYWIKAYIIDRPEIMDIESVIAVLPEYVNGLSHDPLQRLDQVVFTLTKFLFTNNYYHTMVKEWCRDMYEADYLIYKEG